MYIFDLEKIKHMILILKIWLTVTLKNHMSSSTMVYAMDCWYLSYSKNKFVSLMFETSLKILSNMKYKNPAHFKISSSHINKF